MERLGTEAVCIEVYDDETCSLRFDDGVELDFPFEAIGEQILNFLER